MVLRLPVELYQRPPVFPHYTVMHSCLLAHDILRVLVYVLLCDENGISPMLLYFLCNRSQVWQWVKHSVKTAEGKIVTPELVASLLDEEAAALKQAMGEKK